MRRNLFFILRVCVYTALIVFFLLRPALGIDLPCYYYQHFGWLCPTCGFVRGFTEILRGHLGAALSYSPLLTLLIAPLAALLVGQDLWVGLPRLFTRRNTVSALEYLAISVFGNEARHG